MMDTDLSLSLALILFIVLIIFDLAFYRFRQKQSDENEPEFSLLQDALRRLRGLVQGLRKPSTQTPPFQETQSAEIGAESPETGPAIAARIQEPIISQSPTPKKGKRAPAADGRPTVHVQVSADIPEGTIVRITMEVVNAEGKVVLQQQSISGSAYPKNMSPVSGDGTSSISLPKIRQWAETQLSKITNRANLHRNLFWGAIIVYALVVSIGIDRYPIYFFTDEAAHMNMAADFIRDGFKNYYGEFLPTFFSTEGWVNGTSVYVQLIPYLLFGKSVIVTRLVSAFITLLGAVAIGLLLKQVFKIKYYWAGIFLLVTTPAWFLHARTAFEYAEVGAFYAIFLYFYGRYRKGDLRSLYFAVFAGALCFYTHGLGEILMGVTALALFIVDFRYHIHRRQRKTVLLGFGLAILLALPFVRYYLAHPTESAEQVKRRGSYWANTGLPPTEKITDFVTQYTYGLNPLYWYFPNNIDLDRHRMPWPLYANGLWWLTLPLEVIGLFQILRSIRKFVYRLGIIALLACPILPSWIIIGLGDRKSWDIGPSLSIPLDTLTIALWFSFALMLLGVFLALRYIRIPAHRLVLIALLACPIPASVAAIGMPRMLWMAIPIAILSTIGLSAIIQSLETSRKIQSNWPAWAAFGALTILSAFILKDALVNGPTWFQDYGLYGMQYGASQVFGDTVAPELQNNPNVRVIVSPSWANGTEQFNPFFIPEENRSRVAFGQPSDYIDSLMAGTPELLFIATADEYNQLASEQQTTDPTKDYSKLAPGELAAAPKYKEIIVHEIIPYPNGQPGFYLISVTPSDNIKEIMAAEHERNRTPIEDTMLFNGETIRVVHSPLSAGRMEDNFDNDPDTFTRALEANPYVIDLYPLTPIDTHSVFIKTGSLHDYTITIRLYAPGSDQPVIYTQTYKDAPDKDLPPDPEVTINFDRGPEKSARIEIEVKDNISGETSQIHLRTIQFK